MEIKVVTIPILGILIIGGLAAAYDVEYKSHKDNYDITTIYKLQSAYNTREEGTAFNNPVSIIMCPECYDVKVHLKTNAIGMPIELNGQILSSDKRSLEFIAGKKSSTDIITRNEIEYDNNDWRILESYMSNKNDRKAYHLLAWIANSDETTFKIKWKQRNTIQTCISVSYLLEDESKCTFEMELKLSEYNKPTITISESKELKTFLFKSDTLLYANYTYSLNFKLKKKTKEEKIKNPNYNYYRNSYNYNYRVENEYIFKTVPVDGCVIGIKRIAQCTDEYENEEILTITTKELQKTPLAASLTFDVYPFVYSSMEKSSSPTLTCLNGGYAYENGCTCPPGFKGNKCEQGCGPNAFGFDCTGLCSMHQTQCQKMMICSNGFGCKCPTGYSGNDCATECTSGTYGVNCEQRCSKSCGSKSCDIFTGVCNRGCKTTSYIAPDCTEKYPWVISPPQLESSYFTSLVLSIDLSSKNIKGSTSVKSVYYQIIFQAVSNESAEFQYLEPKEIGDQKSVLETIDNLKQGVNYSFGVILISEDGNYNTDDIIKANYSTKCLLPSNINYDVNLFSGTDYINVTWNKIDSQNDDECKVTDYLLKLMFNYTYNQQKSYNFEEVKSNNINKYTFEKLLSGEKYAVQVTALSTLGETKSSEISYINTKPYGPVKIKNIKAKQNQSSSLILTWDIDEKYKNTPLDYIIKYKVIRHLSCSHQVVTNNWTSLLVYNQLKREIWDLIPNTQYVIKVDPTLIGHTYNDYDNIIFVKTPISNPILTPKVNDENGSYITNQSAYFSWTINKQTECCKLNGFFRGYYVVLRNIADGTQEVNYTKQNMVNYNGLKPDTKYELQVYVWTNYGYNSEHGLLIQFKTKTKFLVPVDGLVVYKKNLKHKSIGIRWSFPDEYIIDGFIVIAIDDSINCTKQITIEPERCVAWPKFYCTTLENIIPNHQYTIKMKAKSPDYPTGGSVATVVSNFNNGLADKPENLKSTDVGPTYITLKWDIPLVFNGVLKSFVVNTVEISSKDPDNCCDSKPDLEIPVTEEVAAYGCTITDLKPGSTYTVGVFSKTLSYGQTSRINVTTTVDEVDVTTVQPIEITVPTLLFQAVVVTDPPMEIANPTTMDHTHSSEKSGLYYDDDR